MSKQKTKKQKLKEQKKKAKKRIAKNVIKKQKELKVQKSKKLQKQQLRAKIKNERVKKTKKITPVVIFKTNLIVNKIIDMIVDMNYSFKTSIDIYGAFKEFVLQHVKFRKQHGYVQSDYELIMDNEAKIVEHFNDVIQDFTHNEEQYIYKGFIKLLQLNDIITETKE